jgi:hypothetical protein
MADVYVCVYPKKTLDTEARRALEPVLQAAGLRDTSRWWVYTGGKFRGDLRIYGYVAEEQVKALSKVRGVSRVETCQPFDVEMPTEPLTGVFFRKEPPMPGFYRIAVLALALVSVGCTDYWTIRYQPKTATQPKTVSTPKAVRFYEGDVAALDGANARPIGTLTITASSHWSSTRLEEAHAEAAEAAARRGGTHFLFLAPEEDRRTVTILGSSWAVSREKTTLRGASYLVVRVEADAWGQLPEALRPSRP